MRTVAIIQARMASTRLPGKILLDLAGRPLLERVVLRAKKARQVDMVVVATTESPGDDKTVEECRRMGVASFRGSEVDVLDRFYRAAGAFDAGAIVRLTADCPLLDPQVIDRVVGIFHSGDFDYVSNTLEPTYPDGLDTEVFSRAALEQAWREAALSSEREHVTPYIWKHPELFRLANVRNDPDLHEMRWTVDEPEDLELARRIYENFDAESVFAMQDIVALLQRNPALRGINSGFERNEGYQKSLQEDTHP